ncbi:hypothetical protein QSJ19_15980 [Gordonia sp. ABSL11-1]|uniref:hypothetical protein n=1 Tax=Gordonia sp. ABSL11-1 TaxID=3053924 RepID=UPI002572D96E|nr:hypothetical protein [Gordonia sp. ABSL11-1]MDL9947061.1 hypothetical protein [Gordonia sp. ABSL11-1]
MSRGTVWFDDIAAWPSSDDTPASELARALAAERLISRIQTPTEHEAPVLQANVLPSPMDFADAASEADDSDPFEQMRLRPSASDGSGTRRLWKDHKSPILGAAATAVVVGIAAIIAVTQMSDGSSQPEDRAIQSAAPTSSTPSDPCPTIVDGAVTTGHGSGDQKSGAGAILAFNHAYYIERSAAAARAVAAPNAVATADVMQKYIDQRPAGTQHCLSITDRGRGTYSVVLTEIPPEPGAQPIVYRQTIKTIQSRGKTWIASIASEG